MNLRRLSVMTLLLVVDLIAHAETRRVVIDVPPYPVHDMPEKERVMATLASYMIWPAEERPVPPSHLYAEYDKYCKARWSLTAWNIRDAECQRVVIELHKELKAWSDCLAPVANSRTGCVSGAYHRVFWANDMKLEDALAATADSWMRAEDTKWKVDARKFDALERLAWNIAPYERQPDETPEDDPVVVRDFVKHKTALVKATIRLNVLLKELPACAAQPLLEEIRHTFDMVNE
jgi:hypothetical protein